MGRSQSSRSTLRSKQFESESERNEGRRVPALSSDDQGHERNAQTGEGHRTKGHRAREQGKTEGETQGENCVLCFSCYHEDEEESP